MPKKAGIDAPGALHHIIARGIERRKIFLDDEDRENFLERLGSIITGSGTGGKYQPGRTFTLFWYHTTSGQYGSKQGAGYC